MKTLVTLQLIEEARRYELRFACADCAHFVDRACAHGWPSRVDRELREGDRIEFCKEFEAS